MGIEELRDLLDGYVVYQTGAATTKEQLLGLARKSSVR
jgi:hypothetical protein